MTNVSDDTAAPEDMVPPTPPAPSGSDPARDLARLRRTTADSPYGRHIAGVAGGLARHFDIDPVVVRIALVASMIFGVGAFFYGAVWLLVPEDGRDRAPINLDVRTRTVLLWGTALVAAVMLLGIPFGGDNWFPWPLVIVGLVVAAVMHRRERRRAWTSGVGDTSATNSTYAGYVPRPVRPGPIWFGFALATIALAEGVLGLFDSAGHHPNLGAYPAVALGVIGAYLVLGAFWGRAGGLVALGLAAAFATVVGTAANGIGPGSNRTIAPVSAASVMSAYDLGTGSLTLDLSQVRDPKALAGRVIDLTGIVGRIKIIVPLGTGVDFHARVRGAGAIQTWADEHDGPRATYDESFPATAGHPTLTIDASIRFGAIQLENQQ